MKVISIFRKRVLVLIGVLALATVSFVPLSATHSSNQTHQSLVSTNRTSQSIHQTSIASVTGTQPSATSTTEPSLTQSNPGSTSTQSSSISVGTVVAIDPSTGNQSGGVVGCTPCGQTPPPNTRIEVMECPMIDCHAPVVPVPTPTPTPPGQPLPYCIPCGNSPHQYFMADQYVCPMIVCAY